MLCLDFHSTNTMVMTACSEICHLVVHPLLPEASVWSLTSSSEALGLELQHGLKGVADPSLPTMEDSDSKSGIGSLLIEVLQV